ncbi:hypothetical protein [Flavobacterium sp.]|uniref:hypothetical protein n=1 Tax=Flavobacterium sp. TaxID=239 RepID=UPI00262F34C0|nr:hypothetical protein [Flavobacterium sp.]MDD2987158.1 hypothetical protein [Flavobacterium sp.]
MLRANSLLYAVYICLIVSILCGALLYYANLYNQLNLFYNTREDLYIQNQSAVNFALGNSLSDINESLESPSGVSSSIHIKPHGLLDLLLVQSSIHTDTITSAHFVGRYGTEDFAIYLSNFSKGLSFGGQVKLIGNKKLPTKHIREEYLSNTAGKLISTGDVALSDIIMPKIDSRFATLFNHSFTQKISLKDVVKRNDSVYFNSFLSETIEIELLEPFLNNVVIKGNFVLNAKDSIVVGSKAVLEDVILKAPVVRFQEDFSGNVQVFSTKKINLERGVQLLYPSVLCLNNSSLEKSQIKVGENCRVYGAIVQFGNKLTRIEENETILKENTLLVGDIYCSGKLMVGGKVYGSIYTNRFFHKTDFGIHNNCIINAEVDCSKRPKYFVSVPLLENTNIQPRYAIQKKVL